MPPCAWLLLKPLERADQLAAAAGVDAKQTPDSAPADATEASPQAPALDVNGSPVRRSKRNRDRGAAAAPTPHASSWRAHPAAQVGRQEFATRPLVLPVFAMAEPRLDYAVSAAAFDAACARRWRAGDRVSKQRGSGGHGWCAPCNSTWSAPKHTLSVVKAPHNDGPTHGVEINQDCSVLQSCALAWPSELRGQYVDCILSLTRGGAYRSQGTVTAVRGCSPVHAHQDGLADSAAGWPQLQVHWDEEAAPQNDSTWLHCWEVDHVQVCHRC